MKTRRFFSPLIGALLLVGLFASGLPTRSHAQTGSLDTSFTASTDGYVQRVALQPDGKILLGGVFTVVNGPVRSSIARLNADGSLDTGFTASASGTSVTTVAVQADGKILLGGSFNTVNGVARNNVARLNADGSLDTTFTASASGGPVGRSLAVQPDGKIILGGSFSTVNGQARGYIARLNSDGSLDTTFTASASAGYGTGFVDAVAVQPDGRILVGGLFTQVNGQARSHLVRLNADGSLDAGFAASPNNAVGGVAVQADGRIVLGGIFTQVNGQARSDIARLNSDGSLDAAFNANVNDGANSSSIYSLAVQPDGKIILGGDFGQVNGQARSGIARLSGDGSLDTGFLPDLAFGPNASVSTLAVQADGRILLGGDFSQVNGGAHQHIARLNVNGSLDSGFNASANGLVGFVVVQPDGKIVFGGDFTQVNGVAHNNIARLNADGTLDAGFTTSTNFSANTLALQPDGKILLGGFFTQVNGVARNGVARLNADGSLDTAFTATVNDYVNGVTVQPDGKILVGGNFTTANGVAHNHIVRLNADGSLDAGFTTSATATGVSPVVSQIVQPDGKILVGGNFTQVNGVARDHIARLNSDGSLDTGFSASADNYTPGVILQPDGKILLVGQFTQVNGVARNRVARLNSDGSLDRGFAPSLDSIVTALTIQGDGEIVLGGSFTQVNGIIRNYVARLLADGSVDSGFVPGAGVPKLQGLALQPSDGKVVVGGDFISAGRQLANALARLGSDGSLDRTYRPPFSPGDRVQTLTRQGSRAVVFTSALPAGSTTTASSPGAPSATSSAAAASSSSSDGLPPRLGSIVRNPCHCHRDEDGDFAADFKADAGTDDLALCLGVQGQGPNAGKLVLAGRFQHLNPADTTEGVATHANLGRLLPSGHVDAAFSASSDLPVRALATQAGDDKLVIGGDFTQVNGAAGYLHLARLLADGTLDPGFRAAQAIDGSVTALLVQSDAKIVLGGSFSQVQGVSRSHLARVDASGNLDGTFTPAAFTTTNGDLVAISSVVQQPQDGKLIVAGRFDVVGTTTRHNRVRLNTNGSVDASYGDDTGGPDAIVRALALQPDGKALLGGDFTTVDALERAGAARLLGDAFTSLPMVSQWRFLNFGTLDPNDPKAGDLAAPYGDGVTNLLKYALNLNPAAADATVMSAQGTKGLPLVGKDAQGRLTLTFVRRTAASNPGITYTVEFADGLSGTGFAVNQNAVVTALASLDSTWERVTVSDSAPATPQSRRFVRLRVSAP